jgi:hypothetical protein
MYLGCVVVMGALESFAQNTCLFAEKGFATSYGSVAVCPTNGALPAGAILNCCSALLCAGTPLLCRY